MRRRDCLMGVALIVCSAALALIGCTSAKSPDPWAGAGGKKKVLVSFAPLHSFASSVAGPDAEVKCLLTTTGPHTHGDAAPEQIELLRGADLFIVNGLGLDDEADGIATKLTKATGAKHTLNLGSKINPDWLREGECHHDHSKPDEPHEHGIDPHVWLSVRCARTMVASIRDELKRLDPEHAAGYDSRSAAYLAKLDKLEADGKAMLAPKQEKWIVSFHDSLGYFAETYGLKIAKSIQIDPGREPNGDTLKKIIDECQKRRARVIAVEPQFSTRTSAAVIHNALRGLKDNPIDAEFAEVDPLETCDQSQLGPDLYEQVMRKNLAALAKALR